MVNEGIATATDYFHSIPIDIIVVALSILACIAIGYYAGKKTMLAILLALYPTLILFQALPFTWAMPNLQIAYTSAGLFAVIWIASFFVIRPFFAISYPMRRSTQLTEVGLLGVMTVGTTIAMGYHAKLFPALYAFAPQTSHIFQGDIAFFAWALIPLIGIILFIRA